MKKNLAIAIFFVAQCIILLQAVDTPYYTFVNSTDKAITISFAPSKIQKSDCTGKFNSITIPSKQSKQVPARQVSCAIASFSVSQEKAIGASYDIKTSEREDSLTFTISRDLVLLKISRSLSSLAGGGQKKSQPENREFKFIGTPSLKRNIPIKFFYKKSKLTPIEILRLDSPILKLRIPADEAINSFQILGEASRSSSIRPVLASYYPKDSEEVFVIEQISDDKFKIYAA